MIPICQSLIGREVCKMRQAQANEDIRQYAKEKNVHLWEVAQQYGCNDGNFSRRLRKELTEDEKKHIRETINQIAENRE